MGCTPSARTPRFTGRKTYFGGSFRGGIACAHMNTGHTTFCGEQLACRVGGFPTLDEGATDCIKWLYGSPNRDAKGGY